MNYTVYFNFTMKPRKKKIMNLMVAIVVILGEQLTVAQDLKSNRDTLNFIKQRPIIRDPSDLRPLKLATALGFGKRSSNTPLIINEKPKYLIFLSPVQAIYKRIPIYWYPLYSRKTLKLQEKKSKIFTKYTLVPSRVLNSI